MSWTEEKINQTIIDIKKRASEDEAYRQLCLDNPHEAIKQISDIEVPGGLKINIVENNPDVDHTIMLPSNIAKLGKMEFEDIQGGRCGVCPLYHK